MSSACWSSAAAPAGGAGRRAASPAPATCSAPSRRPSSTSACSIPRRCRPRSPPRRANGATARATCKSIWRCRSRRAGPMRRWSGVKGAARGVLRAEPTICVAQPTALDPSRAPEGRHILWIQLPECPREPVGDAAGLIAVPAGARWTTPLREAYAERVIERLARQVPNLRDSLLARAVLSPTDLEGLNMNLVGGDPYGGDCSLDQSFLWRPLRAARNHETHLAHLWHIGASTHPGPGLGGGSGLHLAKALGPPRAADPRLPAQPPPSITPPS